MLEERTSLFSLVIIYNVVNDERRNCVDFLHYGLKSKVQFNVAPDLVIITPTEQYFA